MEVRIVTINTHGIPQDHLEYEKMMSFAVGLIATEQGNENFEKRCFVKVPSLVTHLHNGQQIIAQKQGYPKCGP